MKTIQIPDEMYDHLIQLSTEMNTQDPRGTAGPHIFQIIVPDSELCVDGSEEFSIWLDDGSEEAFRTEHDDFLTCAIEYIKEHFDEDDYEGTDIEDEGEVEAFLLDNDMTVLPARKTERMKGFFLTHESAKRHWEANKHHYPDVFSDYLDHCWRDPDMEVVQEFLCSLT